MPVEILQEKKAWPLRVRAAKPSPQSDVRTIRVGLLGLGQVGQAVARLASDRSATAHAGIRFHVEQAFVRDPAKARRCPKPGRLTANPAAFLRGNYDVVVEALDAVEPARTLVTRLLGRGTSVVTANKALVAEHGAHLEAVAAAHGASFRFEATALSAVPFLGTLADRPLVASVDRVLAIVNGTSNYVLSSLAEGAAFDAALARAQELGLAEPDPSRDIDGLDAADKLLLLTSLFGWGRLSRESLDVGGIRGITRDDLTAARSLGGTIKPLVYAQRDTAGVRAFVGPAFIAANEPLASLSGSLNGIRLDGRHISNLFFSGPGAGPEVTAATLLDDVAQAALERRGHNCRPPVAARPVFAASPATRWFVRLTFPGIVPAGHALAAVAASAGLYVDGVCDHASDHSRWLIVGPHGRRDLDAALSKLETTHRIQSLAFRRI
ncbi:MAG TPA: homoserine dehydrogenase [Vicinamibacterales bacterium]|nr:homoserine dehydrogenase [Vicinamibacterales bacterium]